MQQMEARLGNLEGAYRQVADRLNGMDMRIESLDRKIDGLRGDMTRGLAGVDGKIDSKIDALRHDIDRRFMWLMGMVMTSWVTTILAVVFHR
jgi:hypothetical protein